MKKVDSFSKGDPYKITPAVCCVFFVVLLSHYVEEVFFMGGNV
jgi:hypothetical protein